MRAITAGSAEIPAVSYHSSTNDTVKSSIPYMCVSGGAQGGDESDAPIPCDAPTLVIQNTWHSTWFSKALQASAWAYFCYRAFPAGSIAPLFYSAL